MDELTVELLIAKIKDPDDKVRYAAWMAAGSVGAKAIKPLAEVAKGGDPEVARAANQAMWQIVRRAGRPGADAERADAVDALAEILLKGEQPAALRRDVIWMLSEIVDDSQVDLEAAKILQDPELREDARCALQRIGGPNSLAVLKQGFADASGEFKAALACSLRARGVDVAAPPCPKLVPSRQTKVPPIEKQ